MKRAKGPTSILSNHSSVLDTSIHGDELENHRIQLESNLQNTEMSLRLSSGSDSEDDYHHPHRGENSSVEYRTDERPSAWLGVSNGAPYRGKAYCSRVFKA